MNNRVEFNPGAHPFFAGMKPEQIEAIRRLATPLEIKEGAVLLQEGKPAYEMYLILSGAVSIHTASERFPRLDVYTAGPGELVGWSWLFPPYLTHFEARATEATRVLLIDGARLLVRCEADRELGYEIMKRLAEVLIQRLQAVRRDCARQLSPPATEGAPPINTV